MRTVLLLLVVLQTKNAGQKTDELAERISSTGSPVLAGLREETKGMAIFDKLASVCRLLPPPDHAIMNCWCDGSCSKNLDASLENDVACNVDPVFQP